MNTYVTGKIIKDLREKNKLTQLELANMLSVSDKTISKWETSRGLPDISLIEPLAKALKVSVIELMNGQLVANLNVSSNMLRSSLYVCPICGNIIHATGASIVSCCGINLSNLEAEESDVKHLIEVEFVENEYFVTINHPMTKKHYISFIAYVTCDQFNLVKLYPQQNAETRFLKKGKGFLYAFCNQDGLFFTKV